MTWTSMGTTNCCLCRKTESTLRNFGNLLTSSAWRRKEFGDASGTRSMLRIGCSQEGGDGVCAVGLRAAASDAGVWNLHARVVGVGRLAARLWSNPCSDGVHGSVLEAGVEPSGRTV